MRFSMILLLALAPLGGCAFHAGTNAASTPGGDAEVALWIHKVECRGAAGAYVQEVAEDGPAHHAGIREGDVILRVDGDLITWDQPLAALIGRRGPGEPVRLLVRRGNTDYETTAFLQRPKPIRWQAITPGTCPSALPAEDTLAMVEAPTYR